MVVGWWATTARRILIRKQPAWVRTTNRTNLTNLTNLTNRTNHTDHANRTDPTNPTNHGRVRAHKMFGSLRVDDNDTMKAIKTRKRPGRSFRRRQNRKHREHRDRTLGAHKAHRSAAVIQRGFRAYLAGRYANVCPNNFDDADYINMERVSNIPRGLLVSIDGTGYNALSLLRWFCCKQVNPVTREPVDDAVPTECAAKILRFIGNDRSLRRKRGHFKKRAEFTSVLDEFVKRAKS